MSNVKKTKHRNIANPLVAHIRREFSKSSIASPHEDGRTKRARSRKASETQAIRFASY